MNNADDEVLLRAFAEKRSEEAFRLLVERYAGLVFGVAVRRTTVRELAEEATQNVFVVLARKAHRLSLAGTCACVNTSPSTEHVRALARQDDPTRRAAFDQSYQE
jgi:hypothetical protein